MTGLAGFGHHLPFLSRGNQTLKLASWISKGSPMGKPKRSDTAAACAQAIFRVQSLCGERPGRGFGGWGGVASAPPALHDEVGELLEGRPAHVLTLLANAEESSLPPTRFHASLVVRMRAVRAFLDAHVLLLWLRAIWSNERSSKV